MQQQLELFLPAVCCAYCGKASYEPVWVVKNFVLHTSQFAFCTQDHAEKYYLEQMQRIRHEQRA